MRTFSLLAVALSLALLSSPLDFAHSAPENTFTATSVLDTVDAAPGDGVCADSNGACTLRAAVMEANANAGPDMIELLADTYTLTIPGKDEDNAATGDLDILGNVTITGAGPEVTVIDRENLQDRVFDILSNADVTLTGVTIQNGLNIEGGGIRNKGVLSITNSIVRANVSHEGGGILNYGELSLRDSTISDNYSTFVGGGISNRISGNLSLTDSVVSGNSSQYGGGIDSRGVMTITNSTISGNESSVDGGGLNNRSEDVIIINSTINGNQAGSNGGGIDNIGGINLANSTISYNGANGFGGGIYNANFGTFQARNATFVGNTANDDADGSSENGGGIKNDGGVVRLYNTILAANIHENDSGGFPFGLDDCSGTLEQVSYSLITTTEGCSITIEDSIIEEDPKLDVLADNGGPTHTHALKADSPAIDAGDPNGCKDQEGSDLTTDQRGEPRPFDGDQDGTAVCDIGAYEYLLYQGLTVEKAGTGDGSVTSSPDGIDCGGDCSADLPQGSLVTLTAEPAESSSFTGWSGACAGMDDCQLTLDAGKVVTATFELDQQLTVTKAGAGDGRVTSSPPGIDCSPDCSAAFTHGSLVTLTADPDEGSTFTGWSGACSSTDDCQVTMDVDKTVTATFAVLNDPALKLFLPMSLR